MSVASTTPDTGDVTYEVDVERDVRIPTADPDVTLSGDLYRPVSTQRVPALVTLLPYRKDAGAGAGCYASFRWLAHRGYACLLVDFRGTGSSDGTMRPPFDAGEADDGVAAVEWLAAQSWCTGRVGMWGGSYGAVTSLRTASRKPSPLKAIVPYVGLLDPERDFVHPDGVRGAFTSLGVWGTSNLASQLLPSLLNFHCPQEQERWRQRLEVEPYLVHMFRHGPGDPVWRDRVIDASAITAATLCVAGWRDLFCDGSIRAYEQIQGPKKLIAGPWLHGAPHESPFEAIDFLPIVKRWFDQWLRDVDTGVMDEPAISVYVQGERPGWCAYESWPPEQEPFELIADSTLSLVREDAGSQSVAIPYPPDPTTGALSGLWSSATGGYGLPLDQHDDDMRAISLTSDPLAEDLLVAGRPHVVVTVADNGARDGSVNRPERLVVRLVDVDPAGRATMITAGLQELASSSSLSSSSSSVTTSSAAEQEPERVTLWPTTYRVAAGHRIRVVVSETDFPRLWPVAEQVPWSVSGLRLSVPATAEGLGKPLDFDPPSPPSPDDILGLVFEPRWEIRRDHINDGIEVTWGTKGTTRLPHGDHVLESGGDTVATVRRDAPEAAVVKGTYRTVARLGTGETIEVEATSRLSNAALWLRGRAVVDGATVFSRTWQG